MSKTVIYKVNACCNSAYNAFSQSGSDSCFCDVVLHEIKHTFPLHTRMDDRVLVAVEDEDPIVAHVRRGIDVIGLCVAVRLSNQIFHFDVLWSVHARIGCYDVERLGAVVRTCGR